MTWADWIADVGLVAIVGAVLTVYIFYRCGKRVSEPNTKFWNCLENADKKSPEWVTKLCFCSLAFFIISFMVTGMFIMFCSGDLADVTANIGGLEKKGSIYYYSPPKSLAMTIRDKETISYIDNELESNKYNYYDVLNVKYELAEVSFLDCLYGVSCSDKDVDILRKPSKLDITRQTEHIEVRGVLKTDAENDTILYRIGNYTLHGKDEKGIISSLANNTEVSLDIVYDTSTSSIVKYKILSAKTI